MFRFKKATPVARPKVTPDPAQAAELKRKQAALNYQPELGFHAQRFQPRLTRVR